MDGFETTRAIWKRSASRDKPRIIAIAAYALEDDREKCPFAGMDDYISKPIKLDELRLSWIFSASLRINNRILHD